MTKRNNSFYHPPHQVSSSSLPSSSSSASSSSFSSFLTRTLIAILGLWVPALLLCSWQSTHRWNMSVIQEVIFETNGTSRGKRVNQLTLDDDYFLSSMDEDYMKMDSSFHFCGKSRVTARMVGTTATTLNDNNKDDSEALTLLYQCSGSSYQHFASNLHALASNQSKGWGDYQTNMDFSKEDECSAFSSSSSTTTAHHHPLWGKRDFPLPDNVTVLVLGNSHIRQISKTLACQYTHILTSIRFLPSPLTAQARDVDVNNKNNTSHAINQTTTPTSTTDAFVLEFANNARWVSITNTVLVYSQFWKKLLEEFFLSQQHVISLIHGKTNNHPTSMSLEDMDAIVLGKFTTYEEAQNTNFERSMVREEKAYGQFRREQQQQDQDQLHDFTGHIAQGEDSLTSRSRKTTSTQQQEEQPILVDFVSIPPPDLVDLAKVYDGPIISVNMFSKSDVYRARGSYKTYREQCLSLSQQKKKNEMMESSRSVNNGTTSTTTTASSNMNPVNNVSINKNVYLIDGRRYIDQLGMECGTDDKTDLGTCHEPSSPSTAGAAMSNNDNKATSAVLIDFNNNNNGTNMHSNNTSQTYANHRKQQQQQRRYRDASDMHRCAGPLGGHADLVAWDVMEGIYHSLSNNMMITVT